MSEKTGADWISLKDEEGRWVHCQVDWIAAVLPDGSGGSTICLKSGLNFGTTETPETLMGILGPYRGTWIQLDRKA